MNDNFDDILRCIELDDPAYDLELVNISKLNFDPVSPASTMNKNLEKFKDKFIFGHINAHTYPLAVEKVYRSCTMGFSLKTT